MIYILIYLSGCLVFYQGFKFIVKKVMHLKYTKTDRVHLLFFSLFSWILVPFLLFMFIEEYNNNDKASW